MPRKKRCASPLQPFDDFDEDFEDEVSSNGKHKLVIY